MYNYGLHKNKHLCSRTAINSLFLPGVKEKGYTTSYPWRAVWLKDKNREDDVNKIIVSVPKKKLKKAVDRVRMRRLCKEAYRLQQYTLPQMNINIAFIYIGDKVNKYENTYSSISNILSKIKDRQKDENNQ